MQHGSAKMLSLSIIQLPWKGNDERKKEECYLVLLIMCLPNTNMY